MLFDRRLKRPRQFPAVVPKELQEHWLARATQIVPVDIIAAVFALSTFADRFKNADVLLFIDLEAVESALIKGYSCRKDLCLITSEFWDLVFFLKAKIFIDRISTDANPSGWPFRNRPFIGRSAGWSTVDPIWPVCFRFQCWP